MYTTAQKRERGALGERLAAEWLLSNGFEIHHLNWRAGRYEIDIVAEDAAGDIHIVEVKTRRAGGLTLPEEAMTPAKCRSLFSAARAYIAMNNLDRDIHFDLMAIELQDCEQADIRFIADAFVPHW